MDAFESEDIAAVRETARRFAADRLASGYRAREAEGVLPRELMREMGSLGLIAPELPVAHGGAGTGCLVSGAIIEEIARADFNFAYVSLLASLNGQIVAEFAREGVAADWLPRLIAGEALLALALTEPGGGSDAARLALKMRREGDVYVLDGEKTSISAADQADAAIVFARTGTPEDGARGVSALLVPMDLDGVSRTRFEDMGQRIVGRGSIFFDGVRVPADHLLGEEGMGFRQVMKGFDFSRALIGLQCLGAARQSLEETWSHVTERQAFGRPISEFQGVSHRLAEVDTLVASARLSCMNALWLKDRDLPHSAEAAMCKWWAPLVAQEAIQACLLMHGHAGYSRDLAFEQRLRDVIGLQIGDGTAQIMKTVIARQRAGRSAIPY